jgi:hypothetical protein
MERRLLVGRESLLCVWIVQGGHNAHSTANVRDNPHNKLAAISGLGLSAANTPSLPQGIGNIRVRGSLGSGGLGSSVCIQRLAATATSE